MDSKPSFRIAQSYQQSTEFYSRTSFQSMPCHKVKFTTFF